MPESSDSAPSPGSTADQAGRPGPASSRLLPYAVAVASVLAAALLRGALDGVVHDKAPYIPFFMAIVVSAWVGGFRPGLLAVLLSALTVDYYFQEPRYHFAVSSSGDWLSLTMFVLTSAGIAAIGGSQWSSRRRAEANASRAQEFALQRAEGEALLATTLRSIGDAVMTTDAEGRVTFLNPIAEALTGWTQETARGRACGEVFRIVDEHTRQSSLCPVEQALRENAIVGLANHTLLLARDGAERSIDDSAAPICSPDGEVRGTVLVFRDITDRKRAEETLRLSEARYRGLYSAMGEGMALHEVVCDPEGKPTDYRILDVNPAFETITGLSRTQAVGRLASDLYGTGEPPYLDVYAAVARTGRPETFETEFEPMRKAFHISVFSPAQGQFATVFEDITGRRQRERQIDDLNQRLQRAMAETHHRVKNNLQTIAALIDMQQMTDRPSVPTAELERLGRHVRGLASIHDLLTTEARANGDSEFISVRDALDKLKPLLDNMVGGRELHFHVQDLKVPVRQGTALAVLVNELVSNAVKHGDGAIDLSLALVADRASLEVRDHGPGFPPGFDAAAAANTGLDLVDNLGRWDLQGEVEFGNALEGGACVTIRFPVET